MELVILELPWSLALGLEPTSLIQLIAFLMQVRERSLRFLSASVLIGEGESIGLY
jgi:hypothetical protein